MASTNGFRIQYEENPRSELTPAGTAGTGPNRISTVTRDFPTTGTVVNPNPALLTRNDETRNIPAGPAALENTFAPSATLAERIYLDDLTFLIPLAGYTATPTTGNGVITDPDGGTIPTGATRWQYVRKNTITPQTAQILAAYANEGTFLQGSGFAISNWTLNADGQYGSTWEGLYLASVADPNITFAPLAVSILPARRADMKVTWLSGGAVASDFSLSDATGLAVSYDLGANGSFFPSIMEVADALPELTGSITKRQINSNDWASLISAGTFSAVAKWIQTKVIGATTYTYKMWAEMPSCQLTGMTPDALSSARRRGASYAFRAALDTAAGYDVRWTIVGSVSTISTYP